MRIYIAISSSSAMLCLRAAVTLTMVTLARTEPDDPHADGDNASLASAASADAALLDPVVLQRARVEAVKRGILEQLGLTEAPRPPSPLDHGASPSRNNTTVNDRRVLAAYRRTVMRARSRSVGNDVISQATGNDVIDSNESGTPTARQIYSFKGHASPGSGCAESADHVLLFHVVIPEPTAPGIETVVTSATLRLHSRRQRATRPRARVRSPTEDIATVSVYHDNQSAPPRRRNATTALPQLVTSRAVTTRVDVDDALATRWEDFDVTSAVRQHLLNGGGKAGVLRLKVRVSGAAAVVDWHRRGLSFGENGCDGAAYQQGKSELRHRHYPLLDILMRDRVTLRSRRSKRSLIQDAALSSLSASNAADTICHGAAAAESRCCGRRPLWISFREIGWDNWILEPEGYEAFYCYGACPPGHRTAHNHAAIRHRMMSGSNDGGGGAARSVWEALPILLPACTASRLGSLTLVHFLNGRQVVSTISGMIVEECLCA